MFIRFQYILTYWHGSLIRNPLEVTSAFTLFVASLFSSLIAVPYFLTYAAISLICPVSSLNAKLAECSHFPLNGEMYLTDRDVTARLHISKRTLQEYRHAAILPYFIIGGKVLYRGSDIQALLESNYRNHQLSQAGLTT